MGKFSKSKKDKEKEKDSASLTNNPNNNPNSMGSLMNFTTGDLFRETPASLKPQPPSRVALVAKSKLFDNVKKLSKMVDLETKTKTKARVVDVGAEFDEGDPDMNSIDRNIDSHSLALTVSVSGPVDNSKNTKSSSLVLHKSIDEDNQHSLIRLKESRKMAKPEWHAPWKLKTVISGHTGPVRALAVDVSNEWFCSGAGDRIIKIWDLASGNLKLSLTGHISTVRGLAVSDRHPYLFSAGEDKQIKCWDLEYNRVIRHYHGHLSGIYCLKLHPTLDILVTGGRDATARMWDMRTKNQIHALTGHVSTVSSVETLPIDPQIITGSEDSTVKLWDITAGKTMTTLTHHKKGVRAMTLHPKSQSFVTGSSSSIKQWKLPEGNFIQNLEGQNTIINAMACNTDSVMFSGGDNGSMHFWDWKTGYNFQIGKTKPQPGSLENEAGVYSSLFDRSGSRLITGEADKSIKIWKEDEDATEESHPITNWVPKLGKLYGL